MHFASKYVLSCDPEFEYVSDDEFEEGMAVSDDDEPTEPSLRGCRPTHMNVRPVPPPIPPRMEPAMLGGPPPIPWPMGGGRPGTPPVSPMHSPPTEPVEEMLFVSSPPPPPPPPSDLFGVPLLPLPSEPPLLLVDELPPPPPQCAGFEADGAPGRGAAKKKHHWRHGATSLMGEDEMQKRQRGRRFRRADTNVVSVKFDQLESPSFMHAGDATLCTGCQAILSHISSLTQDGPDKVWVCEFCKQRNVVDIEEEEIPSKDDVTFLVEPALATSVSGPSGQDDSLVIFVIDISGSMCVTTEVSGRVRLRGMDQAQERMQGFVEDRASQFLPYQNHNVTYISRLQAVQVAVDHQLEEMARNHAHRRVALITFNNEVEVIGDGSSDRVVIAGNKLTSMETLARMGTELTQPRAVKETRKTLGDKLFQLEEGGWTALGPALVVATNMAARHAGSKVILCTDGLANVGLGRLDKEDGDDLYETVSQQAVDKGVTISVITIKGTSCKLVELGKLADQTGGQVNIVDPLKLTEEFSTILADRILATNVEATFIVHKDLFIINEDVLESRLVRKIGNVTKDSEVTFEYSRRPKEPKQSPKKVPVSETLVEVEETASMEARTEADAEAGAEARMETEAGLEAAGGEGAGTEGETEPGELPFQLQISYLDSDGTKALRVFTQMRPVTADRTLAEINADLDILGTHAAQRSAQLALAGDYTMSRGTALMQQRLAWRSYTSTGEEERKEKRDRYRSAFSRIQLLENRVNMAQQSERSRYGGTCSDDDADYYEDVVDSGEGVTDLACPVPPPPRPQARARSLLHAFAPKKSKSKQKKRSKDVDDDLAQNMYMMSRESSSKK